MTTHTCCEMETYDEACAACASEDPVVVVQADAVMLEWEDEYRGYMLGARKAFFQGVEAGRRASRRAEEQTG